MEAEDKLNQAGATTPEKPVEPTTQPGPEPAQPAPQPAPETSPTPVADTPAVEQPVQGPAIDQPTPPTPPTPSTPPTPPMQPVDRMDVPTVADTTVMDGNHKPKIGIIAAIIGGALLLIVVGVLIWFFAFYNSAKTIAADAVVNLVTSPNLHIKGVQDITPANSSSGVNSLSIRTDSASRYYGNILASSTDATVSVNMNGQSTDLNLGIVADQNKKIYININGISDALDQASSTTYGQQIAPFKDFLTMLEKDWWQIDISDISSSLGLSASQKQALEDSYNCVFGSLNQDNFKTVGEIYSRHQFLSAIQDGERQAYRMDIDSTQLADFINELAHSDMVNKVTACINDAGKGFVSSSVDNTQNVSADKVAEVVKQMPVIYAKIDTWGHRMTQIFFDQTDSSSNMKTTARYDIEYPASVEIKTPDSYRPASEAIQAFVQLIMQQSTTGTDTSSGEISIEAE